MKDDWKNAEKKVNWGLPGDNEAARNINPRLPHRKSGAGKTTDWQIRKQGHAGKIADTRLPRKSDSGRSIDFRPTKKDDAEKIPNLRRPGMDDFAWSADSHLPREDAPEIAADEGQIGEESAELRGLIVGGIFLGLFLITLVGVFLFFCVVKPALKKKVKLLGIGKGGGAIRHKGVLKQVA